MTAETIHTCSYACERPECIRAQRDELAARMTATPPADAEVRARELLADAYAAAGFPESASDVRKGRNNYGALERASLSAIAAALSQQPEARELLDARVIDSLINANEEIHAAAAELASCLAEAIAAGATDIPLTHRAGMALTKHESLTEARNVR